MDNDTHLRATVWHSQEVFLPLPDRIAGLLPGELTRLGAEGGVPAAHSVKAGEVTWLGIFVPVLQLEKLERGDAGSHTALTPIPLLQNLHRSPRGAETPAARPLPFPSLPRADPLRWARPAQGARTRPGQLAGCRGSSTEEEPRLHGRRGDTAQQQQSTGLASSTIKHGTSRLCQG